MAGLVVQSLIPQEAAALRHRRVGRTSRGMLAWSYTWPLQQTQPPFRLLQKNSKHSRWQTSVLSHRVNLSLLAIGCSL